MIRLFDILLSFLGIVFLFPMGVVIYIIGLFDTGSPIFIQERVGKNKQPFYLLKFRTMTKETASVASHLVNKSAITKFGRFLRKTKLDELPQLINVLKGEMSLVGPRPNLFNQTDLIQERDKLGVYDVAPGITGLAQINTIDMSTPKKLAKIDARMIKNYSLSNYFKYILAAVDGKGQGDGAKEVAHTHQPKRLSH